jgi:F-type H+-transporting ATPase subunit delta
VAHDAHSSSIATRYATAIFDLARDEKSLDVVDRDLTSLKAMVASSPDLARLVRAPVFSNEEQAAGLNAVLHRMEASPLTRRFLLLLAQKRRLFYLTDIIRAFHGMVARQRGEIEASVTSAHALGDAQIASLKQILKNKLGRDARLEMKVDPRLLGGLVVKVGSRMIDSSLRTKLDGLRAAMRGN